MRKFAMVAAVCAAACASTPASAIYIEFSVDASGTHQRTFRVPVGQEPSGATCGPTVPGQVLNDCFSITPESRTFNFAQDFIFTNGVFVYDAGRPELQGETSFTLTDIGSGDYLLSGFGYVYSTLRAGQPYGDYVLLSAPSQTVSVPEPATWAMLIIGFGAIGVAVRQRRISVAFA